MGKKQILKSLASVAGALTGGPLGALLPTIVDAFKDKDNRTNDIGTLMVSYPLLGMAIMSFMSLPQEPSTRDWVVTAGITLIAVVAFVIRSQKPDKQAKQS